MEGLMTVAAAELPGFKHTLYLLMKNIMSGCRGSRAGPPERAVGCKICSEINISIFLFSVFFLYKNKREICIFADIMFAFGLHLDFINRF